MSREMTDEERQALLDTIDAELHKAEKLANDTDNPCFRDLIVGRIGGLDWARNLIEKPPG